jgi:hypothetical protein
MYQMLTSDAVTVSVASAVYYRVCNATVSVANIANAHDSTRLMAQTTLYLWLMGLFESLFPLQHPLVEPNEGKRWAL